MATYLRTSVGDSKSGEDFLERPLQPPANTISFDGGTVVPRPPSPHVVRQWARGGGC